VTTIAQPSPLTLAIAERIREVLAQRGEPMRSDRLAELFPVPVAAVRDALDYLAERGEVVEEETTDEPGDTGP
jgi:DNA-binding GntR family transcriptional regulator